MVIVSLDVDFFSITILDGLPWYFSIALPVSLPELPNPHGAKLQDLGQEFLEIQPRGTEMEGFFWGGKSSRNRENHRKYIATNVALNHLYIYIYMMTVL